MVLELMIAAWRRWVGGLVVLVLFSSIPAQAQHWSDEAWTPIVEHQGVAFSYIFYREADNTNNGVVVRLHNENDYSVRYRFDIIFRTGHGDEHVEQVEGTLRAHQMKTGENDGLFWIPFADGRSIGEVGLRGYAIEPIRDGPS